MTHATLVVARGSPLNGIHENIRTSGRNPSTALAGFAAAWLAFFLILFVLPTLNGLSSAGMAVLSVVAWASIMWVTEAIPVGISGLLIPMLLVLTGGAKPFASAASGFSTPVVVLCLTAFIFAAVMQAAGLDRRIALSLLKWMKAKTVNGVIWAMFAVNFVLSLIIPAANARAATLLPVINGICNFFDDDEKGKAGKKAIVIQTLVYGSMISGMCILTAHLPNYVLINLFAKNLKISLSYLDWFKLQWPYLGMFVITQWWVQYYFRTRGVGVRGGHAAVEQMYAELPKTSQTEWVILVVFGAVALGWMLEPLHKVAAQNVALIGLAALFFPGVLSFKWQEIQNRTIWGTLLLLAGALSLSAAMSSSGLAKYLADIMAPIAVGHSWWMTLLIMMVGTHIIRIGMLSNVAAITMLAPILVALAPKLGLHPVAFTMLVADTDTFAYLLPTQITAAVIAYSSGTFGMQDYFKVGWVAVIVAILYGIFVIAPWYAFMGVPVWNPAAPWPYGEL